MFKNLFNKCRNGLEKLVSSEKNLFETKIDALENKSVLGDFQYKDTASKVAYSGEKYNNQTEFLNNVYDFLSESQIVNAYTNLGITRDDFDRVFLGRGINIELPDDSVKEDMVKMYKAGRNEEEISTATNYHVDDIYKILLEQERKGKITLAVDERKRYYDSDSNHLTDYLIASLDQTKLADYLINKSVVKADYRTDEEISNEVTKIITNEKFPEKQEKKSFWKNLNRKARDYYSNSFNIPSPIVDNVILENKPQFDVKQCYNSSKLENIVAVQKQNNSVFSYFKNLKNRVIIDTEKLGYALAQSF